MSLSKRNNFRKQKTCHASSILPNKTEDTIQSLQEETNSIENRTFNRLKRTSKTFRFISKSRTNIANTNEKENKDNVTKQNMELNQKLESSEKRYRNMKANNGEKIKNLTLSYFKENDLKKNGLSMKGTSTKSTLRYTKGKLETIKNNLINKNIIGLKCPKIEKDLMNNEKELLQTKSCQTLRESEINLIDVYSKLNNIKTSVRNNMTCCEFLLIILQASLEKTKEKFIQMDEQKMNIKELKDMLSQFKSVDIVLNIYITNNNSKQIRELINILYTIFIKEREFELTITQNVLKIKNILIDIENQFKNKSIEEQIKTPLEYDQFLPIAIINIEYILESIVYINWIRVGNNNHIDVTKNLNIVDLSHENIQKNIVKCFMFISPTELYNILKNGFNNYKCKHQIYAYQNPLKFIKKETKNLLIWDIQGSTKVNELFIIATVKMINDKKNYEIINNNKHKEKVYRIIRPDSVIIENVSLYSYKNYLHHKENTSNSKHYKSMTSHDGWLKYI